MVQALAPCVACLGFKKALRFPGSYQNLGSRYALRYWKSAGFIHDAAHSPHLHILYRNRIGSASASSGSLFLLHLLKCVRRCKRIAGVLAWLLEVYLPFCLPVLEACLTVHRRP